MRRNPAGILVAGLLAAGLALCVTACSPPPDATAVAELSGGTMGTTYSVKVTPPPDATTAARLQQQIDRRLEQVNQLMSTYRDDSVLSRFNAYRDTDWYEVPAELVKLVRQAEAISMKTDGAYDVTVGPLVNLWGFGRNGRRDTPPDSAAIEALLPRIGFDRLESQTQPPALRKAVAELEVDLSSIAKGWGVDELAELLEREGIRNYLVEIGGELRAAGSKSPGQPWRIAVERPIAGQRSVQRIVNLGDVAMATSGDYRNFFEQGGQRYAHTIDPRSGQTVRHRLASVTVFAPTCAEADGWATALMALGDQQAPAVAERHGIEALFIVRDDDGLREFASSAMAEAGYFETTASR
ncbi:MAG: FAD:protein FMN transferase [Gammaproteobacteria bacterium]|nr:FAD:protein FMN transferase [Gammaproteobacteria bacterium]